MKPGNHTASVRAAALLLALLLAASFLLPTSAEAQSAAKIVRVGWFESPFNRTDALGRRSGYSYEYQQKLAAYSGWVYEYVEGSWPDLLQMLADGRIDLLSDVSYTEERAETMLFSSLPMGAEEYYLFISPYNTEISAEDYATFTGKRVGAYINSVQLGFYRDWAEANGIETEIVELNGSEEEIAAMLNRGEIDMYVSLEAVGNLLSFVPLCKIGSSDFYFAVSKERPELLSELNAAMNRVLDENPFYNQQLNNKFIHTSGVNRYLSAEENAWLAAHGTIRVGYQDNYLAFCARDAKTGELTGALKDCLEVASGCLANAVLDFKAIAFPSAAEALEALTRGEVDCVFPANLTDYDGELRGVFLTPALMRTDVSAVVRASEQKGFFQKERITVAVNANNPNYDIFLEENFPAWRAIYYRDTAECLRAISDGQADCLLLSNYRFNNIAMLCEKYRLVSISTGVEMDYCLAVRREDSHLYSILAKTISLVPSSTVNAALSHHFTEDAKTGLVDLLQQNTGAVTSVLSILALVLAMLSLRYVRANKATQAARRLVSATENDALTGLYSKNYFYEYAARLHRENPDAPMNAIVLSVDQFHSLRALNGRGFGERLLHALGAAILAFLKERRGVAGRIDADRFALYCAPVDDCGALLERLQSAADTLSPNFRIRLSLGLSRSKPGTPPARLVEEAAAACHQARRREDGRPLVFDEAVRERELREARLMNDLLLAADNRELELYYQPKFDLRCTPPKLAGAEALLRWRHPELGLLLPEEFIPLLERSGQIGTADSFAWGEAARQSADWKERCGFTLPLSVNLSRLDLLDATLKNTLDTALAQNGLAHGALRLELSEAACAESDSGIVRVIDALRKDGYEIELDNFGRGASSLKLLSSLPVDLIDLDRGVIAEFEVSEQYRQLVGLILDAARRLRVPVVAEGVESEAQLQMLKKRGCTFAQGFYFAPPLPAAEFEEQYLKTAADAVSPALDKV